MTASGAGHAVALFTVHGIEADVEGSLEFLFLGSPFRGFGHGKGVLQLSTFAGWGWAVVWARTPDGVEPAGELVGGLAVEGSPALGSGSVTGVCAFTLRRSGCVSEYQGTFVTKARSHLAPSARPGTLTLDGEIEITFALAACEPGESFPWDSTRWPEELLSEFMARRGL